MKILKVELCGIKVSVISATCMFKSIQLLHTLCVMKSVHGSAYLCFVQWEQLKEFHTRHYHPSNAR